MLHQRARGAISLAFSENAVLNPGMESYWRWCPGLNRSAWSPLLPSRRVSTVRPAVRQLDLQHVARRSSIQTGAVAAMNQRIPTWLRPGTPADRSVREGRGREGSIGHAGGGARHAAEGTCGGITRIAGNGNIFCRCLPSPASRPGTQRVGTAGTKGSPNGLLLPTVRARRLQRGCTAPARPVIWMSRSPAAGTAPVRRHARRAGPGAGWPC
jgi:hypothetical protein